MKYFNDLQALISLGKINYYQRMEEGSSMLSFDFGVSSRTVSDKKMDHMDRVRNQIRLLESENESLQNQLEYIKKNPQELIKSFQAKLLLRISQLREENQGIEQLIDKSRIPGFVEMTKKKASYVTSTPHKSFHKDETDWANESRRNIFDDIDMSEKGEASTCQDFPTSSGLENPILCLQPLHSHEAQARARLTAELMQVIEHTATLTQEAEQALSQGSGGTGRYMENLASNGRKLEQIAKYKQKLLHLLKKLRVRESTQQQIVRQYQEMHHETLHKLREASELLQQLSTTDTPEQNMDDLYAEAMQLEERLRYINDQLERLDESQWLKDIHSELLHALKRVGISPPSDCKTLPPGITNEGLREKIDVLAEILIECVLSQQADEKQKLAMLKYYYDEEKQNNKKIIKALQNREQGLSKKLIDMQMNN